MKSRHLRDLEDTLGIVTRFASAPEDQLQKIAAQVSAWSVSQQLDHIIKVGNATLGAIVAAKPLEGVPGVNLLGRAVMLLGWFPRGRARAPQRLHGLAVSSKELLEQLDTTRGLVARICDPDFQPADVPVVRHPIFRGLTPAQTLRFVVVHTRHHLKIVRDIRP